jgi:hypothetical protein
MSEVESDTEETAEGWRQYGSNQAVSTLCRKIQIGHDQEAAAAYAAKKRQTFKKIRAAHFKPQESSTEPQSTEAPTTPRATSFDSRRWSERHFGQVREESIVFPPLPKACVPTGSPTGRPLDAGAPKASAGSAPPAQGIQSPTGESSGSAAGSGSQPAAPRPPAEGTGNGGGGGSTA